MTRSDLDAWMLRYDLPFGRACDLARDWLADRPTLTPAEAWATCPRGDWLLWVVERVGVTRARLEPIVRRAVMRAVGYAADAMDRAGMADHAAALRALPADAPYQTIEAAADAAAAAAAAARAALWAADAAVAAALWAADAAAAAALWAAACDAEHALCASDVRATIPWAEVARVMEVNRG